MPKAVKIFIAIFAGLDICVVSFITLAQLRYNLFGTSEVPALGSAFDMGLFLAALLIGWVAGDRLYYFMNYSQRRADRLAAQQAEAQRRADRRARPVQRQTVQPSSQTLATTPPAGHSVWEDRGWDDSENREQV